MRVCVHDLVQQAERGLLQVVGRLHLLVLVQLLLRLHLRLHVRLSLLHLRGLHLLEVLVDLRGVLREVAHLRMKTRLSVKTGMDHACEW